MLFDVVQHFLCYSSDIDECANGNGGCTQLCINDGPDFFCECQAGFELDNDEKTCKCKPPQHTYVHSTVTAQ